MKNLELGLVYHVYDEDVDTAVQYSPQMETATLIRVVKRTHHFKFADGEEYSKGSPDNWRSSAAEAWELYAENLSAVLWRIFHPLHERGGKKRRAAISSKMVRLSYAWSQADAAAADAELSYSI